MNRPVQRKYYGKNSQHQHQQQQLNYKIQIKCWTRAELSGDGQLKNVEQSSVEQYNENNLFMKKEKANPSKQQH